MKIYIASSWRNQHAVEMLTGILEASGHRVSSFIRSAIGAEGSDPGFDLDRWVESEEGARKFQLDTDEALSSDLVIYIGPSGTDAWAEVGAAWGSGVEVMGLWAKDEPAGLMRRMVRWFRHYTELIEAVENWIEGGKR